MSASNPYAGMSDEEMLDYLAETEDPPEYRDPETTSDRELTPTERVTKSIGKSIPAETSAGALDNSGSGAGLALVVAIVVGAVAWVGGVFGD